MKSIITKVITAFILFNSVISCKKEINPTSLVDRGKINQSKVYKYPISEKEKQLVKNLEQVTNVLKVLYKDQSNVKLINAAIYS